jgi:hypothetical protein
MKDLKITAPKGYEIDKDKSTFENIVFKKLNELPKTWEELGCIDGFYVGTYSIISRSYSRPCSGEDKNIFATISQAKASLALAQLSQLRDVYRAGWVPDWEGYDLKFCVFFSGNTIYVGIIQSSNEFLSFQDEETAELFLENFRDLIEQAKPLMS